QELASLLLRLTLAQTVPAALEDDLPERARVLALAGALDPEMVQLYYQIAIQGREDLTLAPDEHAGFLMTLLRMLAFSPSQGEKNPMPAGEKTSAPAKAAKTAAPFDGNWPALAAKLALSGGAKELARNAELKSGGAAALELVVPKSMAHLAGETYREKLQAALAEHFGRPMQLRVSPGEAQGTSAAALEAADRGARRAQAARAVQGDSFVQDLVNLFDGRVVDSTIKDKQ
ncbi:MAG TPA: DNA polymerase III subunit gamma/tau C-terminal domain-containing protein, partial [Burkholderiales bacterium]|nr:DNA polymerase III subunit gamma/tau C-terminal domain-containing protein [Burkholderiales bacterium]